MFDLLKKKLSNWLSSSSKKDEVVKKTEDNIEKPVEKVFEPIKKSKEVKDVKPYKNFDKKIVSKKSDKLKAEIIDDLEQDLDKDSEEIIIEEKNEIVDIK